jgi:hypothetical protein
VSGVVRPVPSEAAVPHCFGKPSKAAATLADWFWIIQNIVHALCQVRLIQRLIPPVSTSPAQMNMRREQIDEVETGDNSCVRL